MAVNPNTTNIAVDNAIAAKMRAIVAEAKKTHPSVNLLQLTNQLLTYALAQKVIKIESSSVSVDPKNVDPVPPRKTRKKKK